MTSNINRLDRFLYLKKAKPAIMKKIITTFIAIILFICTPLFINDIFADLPPDPGGGGPGSGDLPVGGGSPLGGGLIIMAALGVAYGSKKIYDAREKLL